VSPPDKVNWETWSCLLLYPRDIGTSVSGCRYLCLLLKQWQPTALNLFVLTYLMRLTYFLIPCPLIMLLCFANNLRTDKPLSGFWNFLFPLLNYEIWVPSWLYLGVITIDINSVCISVLNSSLFLFAVHLNFFRNTSNVEDWKLLKFHFDAVQNWGLEKGMKQNVKKSKFTLFTLKINGTSLVN